MENPARDLMAQNQESVRSGPLLEKRFTHFSVAVHSSVKSVESDWQSVADGYNIFLGTAYLKALENAPPGNMDFLYCLLSVGGKPVGIIYCQRLLFNAAQSLNYPGNILRDAETSIRQAIRNYVAQKVTFRTLICGNALLTGNHAFLFSDAIAPDVQIRFVDQVLDWLRQSLLEHRKATPVVFLKDFTRPLFSGIERASSQVYHPLPTEPSMVFDIRPEWKSFEDYSGALRSKYRVRARRARKKCRTLTLRKLGLEDMLELRELMYQYYLRIAEKSVFNLAIINRDYFIALQEALGDAFQAWGYFKGDKLLAFYTMVVHGSCLEAHFLGYEEAVNRRHQVYLNILLDIIGYGIKKGLKKIQFARTALEIKSSVGARPQEMHTYIQHYKRIPNALMPVLFQYLDPGHEWTPRSPYKSGN